MEKEEGQKTAAAWAIFSERLKRLRRSEDFGGLDPVH